MQGCYLQGNDRNAIGSLLLDWYGKNKRDLPWRRSPTPYHVWISEIMLQQTRVEAVKPYYERFLAAFPDVCCLAEADEEKLLKHWEGLGYYSRARNLQKAAREMVSQFNGKLPGDYQNLLKLPGIGPYTAGAIASIAFGQSVPAVDGNVLRVFARLFEYSGDIGLNESKKEIAKMVVEVMPKEFPGDFNQGIMELGATVCLPNGIPKCNRCPLSAICDAHRKGQELCFPVKGEKKKRTIEYKNVYFIVFQNRFLLSKRKQEGLLAGLWELPNAEAVHDQSVLSSLVDWNFNTGAIEYLGKAKHIFTHKEWHMDGYYVEAQPPAILLEKFCFVDCETADKEYAVPSAFRKIFQMGLLRMQQCQKDY